MQQAKAQPTHENRLHAAYIKLTFRCLQTDQDARREQLFRRLVLHHLLQHNMYTLFDWSQLEAQQTCVYNFLQAYAKQLWPGKKAERSHLAHPELQPPSKRSFVGSIDDHWSARRNRRPTVKARKINADGKEDSVIVEIQTGFGHDTQIGGMAFSKVGKALTRYVDVLLEPALADADVEDAQRLVEAIVSTVMGPEIPVKPMQEVTIKIEVDSDREWESE